MTLRWVYTEGVGFAAAMPDGRTAYVEPRGDRWRIRVVKRPGSRGLADLYDTKPTADECRAIAEDMAERIRARAQRGAKHAA